MINLGTVTIAPQLLCYLNCYHFKSSNLFLTSTAQLSLLLHCHILFTGQSGEELASYFYDVCLNSEAYCDSIRMYSSHMPCPQFTYDRMHSPLLWIISNIPHASLWSVSDQDEVNLILHAVTWRFTCVSSSLMVLEQIVVTAEVQQLCSRTFWSPIPYSPTTVQCWSCLGISTLALKSLAIINVTSLGTTFVTHWMSA